MLEAYGSKHLEHPLIWPETVEFRLYQKHIADTASERNTLIILPTALGKTVISAMVACAKRKLLKYLTNNLKKKKLCSDI